MWLQEMMLNNATNTKLWKRVFSICFAWTATSTACGCGKGGTCCSWIASSLTAGGADHPTGAALRPFWPYCFGSAGTNPEHKPQKVDRGAGLHAPRSAELPKRQFGA